MGIFLGIGLAENPSGGVSTAAARDALAAPYHITPWNLLPLVLLIVLSALQVPPFLAIFGTALFSRGGMTSILTTVWLILGALSFAAIMERAGFINRLLQPLVHRARSDGRLIAATGLTCIGLNIIAGDQYVADVLPSRAYREEYAKRGLAPRMLSRTVDDTGTVTSPLVPWNGCGAYMTDVLQVPTAEYLPFAFFNLINPLLSIAFGLTGFRVERTEPSEPHGEEPASAPGDSGQTGAG